MSTPGASFAHVVEMTDHHGTFEHALHASPRAEHGYCTDDMARLLVVACRQPAPDREVRGLARTAIRFLADAQGVDGDCRSRKNGKGRWTGRGTVEDSWGRMVWGFGTAAARSTDAWIGPEALSRFDRGAQLRSPWLRATAFAALGAAEVLSTHPGHGPASRLLADAAERFGDLRPAPPWRWPEKRLTYANAVLPDAMMATGVALDRAPLVDEGLALLGWLLERETVDGHLSVTPAGGAGPDDPAPGFDQQPIEAASMADACARAALITGSPKWAEGVRSAVAWFTGDNDAHAPMWDPLTNGGYDGLEPDRPNLNQGAESTLALISTLQHARWLVPSPA